MSAFQLGDTERQGLILSGLINFEVLQLQAIFTWYCDVRSYNFFDLEDFMGLGFVSAQQPLRRKK